MMTKSFMSLFLLTFISTLLFSLSSSNLLFSFDDYRKLKQLAETDWFKRIVDSPESDLSKISPGENISMCYGELISAGPPAPFLKYHTESDGRFKRRNSRLILPDDITSEDGKPLLSWRVAVVLDDYRFNTKIDFRELFNKNESWNSPNNLEALENCPEAFAIHSDVLPNNHGKTFMFRVREVHQNLKEGKYRDTYYDPIPYLVFVDLQNAGPWTEPNDISWKDLASGNVKPTLGSEFMYIGVDGAPHTVVTPLTPIGWKILFDM